MIWFRPPSPLRLIVQVPHHSLSKEAISMLSLLSPIPHGTGGCIGDQGFTAFKCNLASWRSSKNWVKYLLVGQQKKVYLLTKHIIYAYPHAHHRIVSLEETVREKNQKVVEMEMTVSRFTQENRILEERNKVILGHLKHSTPLHSPSKSPLLQVYTAVRLVPLIIR